MKIPITFYGFIARLLSLFIPVKQKYWIFGADFGNSYKEGSKYMLEYMLKEHPEYTCMFITNNKQVYDKLRNIGIPCEMNFSLKGIVAILRAEAVFTTQVITDIHLAFPRNGRKFYYLVHGQPLKVAANLLNKTTFWKKKNNSSFLKRIQTKLLYKFNEGEKESSFLSATSDFLAQYLFNEHDRLVPVKVLGMPRNDALFDSDRMNKENWIPDIKGKFVITYMPTHRAYGLGEVTPTPFLDRPDIQDWMRKNNVVFLMKNHPNMIPKLDDSSSTDVIKDITKLRIDPQVCLYHSDVLVTDFSSVWMDFLLLKRPILFYIYDDFEKNDVGTYYDIRLDPPGHFCYNENDFFKLIKQAKDDYDNMKPASHIVAKYHKYVDGNSCERYYNAIIEDFQIR